jgi:hypothetical protein
VVLVLTSGGGFAFWFALRCVLAWKLDSISFSNC